MLELARNNFALFSLSIVCSFFYFSSILSTSWTRLIHIYSDDTGSYELNLYLWGIKSYGILPVSIAKDFKLAVPTKTISWENFCTTYEKNSECSNGYLSSKYAIYCNAINNGLCGSKTKKLVAYAILTGLISIFIVVLFLLITVPKKFINKNELNDINDETNGYRLYEDNDDPNSNIDKNYENERIKYNKKIYLLCTLYIINIIFGIMTNVTWWNLSENFKKIPVSFFSTNKYFQTVVIHNYLNQICSEYSTKCGIYDYSFYLFICGCIISFLSSVILFRARIVPKKINEYILLEMDE